MAEFPCLPLFTDAYLGDTTHLTTTEHGAYFLLLMAQWRSTDCTLPNDDKLLARYARMTRREWATVKPILEPFFSVTISNWRQKRLSDERKYVESKRQQNISAGRVSALKRKERHSTNVITDVSTERQQKLNQPLSPNPHPKEDTNVSSPLPPKGGLFPMEQTTDLKKGFHLPGWIDPEDWKDFGEMRRRIKKPMTDRAAKAIIKKLETYRREGHDPAIIIEQSIRNGWQDVYPTKSENGNSEHGQKLNTSERARRAAYEGLID